MNTLRDKNGKFIKGNKGFWLGKKRPELTGKKHPHWKGGQVIKTCIVCNNKFKAYKCLIKRTQAKFCSHNCRAKYYFSKEKNINWKGGCSKEGSKFRNSEYYINWRSKVFRRDRWT